MKSKLLDIVIPSFHEPKYLKRMLSSIYDNIYDKNNINVIIIEDSCKYGDEKAAIISDFNIYFDIFLYTNEENLGPGESRNLGLRMSNSDFILFVDDDDALCDDPVKCIDYDYDIISTKYMFVTSSGFITREEEILPNELIQGVHSAIFKTKYIKKNNIWFSKKKHGIEDSMFRVVSFLQTNKIKYINDFTFYKYLSEDSTFSREYLSAPYNVDMDLICNIIWASMFFSDHFYNVGNICNKSGVSKLVLHFCDWAISLLNQPLTQISVDSYYILICSIKILFKFCDDSLVKKILANNMDRHCKLLLWIYKNVILLDNIAEIHTNDIDSQLCLLDNCGDNSWFISPSPIYVPYKELMKIYANIYYEKAWELSVKANKYIGDSKEKIVGNFHV